MEYDGGTYISQVEAPNPRQALFNWVCQLNTKDVSNFGTKSKGRLMKQLLEDEREDMLFVALEGVQNVYCHSVKVKKHWMLINWVQTVK